jgi:hypothetical protein
MYMVKAQMQDHGTNYGQVQWAVSEHVPLMIKPGGMSLYSTVGKGGIVIDLSWLSSVSYNTERQEATPERSSIEQNSSRRACYKKLRLTSIQSYNAKFLPQLANIWHELASTCSDALESLFSI